VVTIRAQHDCTVNEVFARPGMTLTAMTDILMCSESSRAWLEIVLYPDQANRVHEGDTVQVTFSNGEYIQTKLSGLSNITEGDARTIKARIPIKLSDSLHLGDYADVTLLGTPFTALNVPLSSVIRTGRGNYVMRAMGNGHFKLQKIETGITNANRIVIRNGLEAGDKVAINGQFLLDAAASIADSAERYNQK